MLYSSTIVQKSSTVNQNRSGFICFALNTFVFSSTGLLNATCEDSGLMSLWWRRWCVHCTDTNSNNRGDEWMSSAAATAAACNTKTGTCLHFDDDLIIAYGGELQTHREPVWCRWLWCLRSWFSFLFFSYAHSFPFETTMRTRSSTVYSSIRLIWSNNI